MVLRAAGLSKSFPQPGGARLAVLEKIDVTLAAGETECLLGASGCGKTTLLQILAGLDTADSGDIRTAFPRPGPALGYLTQDDSLLPWRSARDNAALGLELRGESRRAARAAAAEMLDKVGLADFYDHGPAQLSGGMKQRVLLARTLALRPKLLLMDEPMSNLDIPARQAMAQTVRTAVQDTGATALIVTHSVSEACFLADRILIITRSPAVLSRELPGDAPMDSVMAALNGALEARTA